MESVQHVRALGLRLQVRGGRDQAVTPAAGAPGGKGPSPRGQVG